MRLTRPTMRSLPIAMATVLCAAPLLASAQAYGPGVAAATPTESAPVASPPPQNSVKKSLMGKVMAALIESAEQTAKHRRDAAHQATALDRRRPDADTHPILPSDPAATSREDAIRNQMAVQDEPR